MDKATIARYQPGGDIFKSLVNTYGLSAANSLATAASTGDRGAINEAFAIVRGDGPLLDDSTTHIFLDQLATDPLSAPLGDANNLIGNSATAFLKNPWVLFALIVGGFFWLGGADLLKRWFKKLG
jgi:hypothetical protein